MTDGVITDDQIQTLSSKLGDIITSSNKGVIENLEKLVAGISTLTNVTQNSNANTSAAPAPAEGGTSTGTQRGAGLAAARLAQREAEQFTDDIGKLKENISSYFSSFKELNEEISQVNTSIVSEQFAEMKRFIKEMSSAKMILDELTKRMDMTSQTYSRGLGGFFDSLQHDMRGVGDMFRDGANLFVGGALSFKTIIEAIDASNEGYAIFQGSQYDYAKMLAGQLGDVEDSLSETNETLFKYGSSKELSAIFAKLNYQYNEQRTLSQEAVDIGGRTLEMSQRAEKLDVAAANKRNKDQLKFLYSIAQNTGKTVEEVMALQANDEVKNLLIRDGSSPEQIKLIDNLVQIIGTSSSKTADQFQTFLEGKIRGTDIGAFDEETRRDLQMSGTLETFNQLYERIQSNPQMSSEDIARLVSTTFNENFKNVDTLGNIGDKFDIGGVMDLINATKKQAENYNNDQNTTIEEFSNRIKSFSEGSFGSLFKLVGSMAANTAAILANTTAVIANTISQFGGLKGLTKFVGASIGNIGKGGIGNLAKSVGGGLLRKGVPLLGAVMSIGEGYNTSKEHLDNYKGTEEQQKQLSKFSGWAKGIVLTLLTFINPVTAAIAVVYTIVDFFVKTFAPGNKSIIDHLLTIDFVRDLALMISNLFKGVSDGVMKFLGFKTDEMKTEIGAKADAITASTVAAMDQVARANNPMLKDMEGISTKERYLSVKDDYTGKEIGSVNFADIYKDIESDGKLDDQERQLLEALTRAYLEGNGIQKRQLDVLQQINKGRPIEYKHGSSATGQGGGSGRSL